MVERQGAVTFKGSPLTLLGPALRVGEAAPDAELVGGDLGVVRLSALYPGRISVVLTVPSLDTPVCDLETKRFNREAPAVSPDLQVLAVSMDLPFAQNRWCGAAGVAQVRTLSDHRDAAFGQAYGVLIKGLRLLARAVFVVDRAGVLRYQEIVPEVTHEPDYAAALAAARTAAART